MIPRDLRVGDGDLRCEGAALTVTEHKDALAVDIGSDSQGRHCGNRVWNVLVGCGEGRGVNRRRKPPGAFVVPQGRHTLSGETVGQVPERLVRPNRFILVVRSRPRQQHYHW